jgi:hypothetical protein
MKTNNIGSLIQGQGLLGLTPRDRMSLLIKQGKDLKLEELL